MSVQRYSCAGFGDSTDFGIYTFPGASPGESEYFKPVTAESKNELLGYIDNFENWVNVTREGDDDNALVVNYHFRATISMRETISIFTTAMERR